jgi:hypothetical protein
MMLPAWCSPAVKAETREQLGSDRRDPFALIGVSCRMIARRVHRRLPSGPRTPMPQPYGGLGRAFGSRSLPANALESGRTARAAARKGTDHDGGSMRCHSSCPMPPASSEIAVRPGLLRVAGGVAAVAALTDLGANHGTP